MRIDLQGSGGFANLKLAYHADTDTLPPAQAEELLKLVESSRVFDLQQSDLTPALHGVRPMYFLISFRYLKGTDKDL